MTLQDDMQQIEEQVHHLRRGCLSGRSHDPLVYEAKILAALARVRERLAKLETVEKAAQNVYDQPRSPTHFAFLRLALAALDEDETLTRAGEAGSDPDSPTPKIVDPSEPAS